MEIIQWSQIETLNEIDIINIHYIKLNLLIEEEDPI